MSETKHLAQLNIATALDDMDSEQLSAFVARIEAVNEVAERADGFVWRLKDEDGGDATNIRIGDNPRLLVNMSVWESAEHLQDFVWNTIHKRLVNKKEGWFETPKSAHFVMWWVEPGHIPTVEEAFERLEDLRANGTSERAFGWAAVSAFKQ